MKVSYDYDGVIGDNPTIIMLAKQMVADGHDVWILTARSDGTAFNENKKAVIMNYDVYDTCDIVGIPHDKVIFTDFNYKVHKFKEHGFDLHFDDDELEIDEINRAFPDTKPGMYVGFVPSRFIDKGVKYSEDEMKEMSDYKAREIDFDSISKELQHLIASRNNCDKVRVDENKSDHQREKATELMISFNKKINKLLNIPEC